MHFFKNWSDEALVQCFNCWYRQAEKVHLSLVSNSADRQSLSQGVQFCSTTRHLYGIFHAFSFPNNSQIKISEV